jgi:hypothetical protein
MIVCLLRCLLLHFLRDCYHLYFHGIDPRVLNYLDVDATVDTSFPSDCSDSGCSPRSGEIFERCSDDSMSS